MRTLTRPHRTLRLLAAAAALGLLVAACGSDDDAAAPDEAETTTTAPQDVNQGATVVIEDFSFGDEPIEIEAGSLVTWENEHSVRHTITEESLPPLFDSPAVQPGDTYTEQFDEPGTYRYFCNIHPDRMDGEIIVVPAE